MLRVKLTNRLHLLPVIYEDLMHLVVNLPVSYSEIAAVSDRDILAVFDEANVVSYSALHIILRLFNVKLELLVSTEEKILSCAGKLQWNLFAVTNKYLQIITFFKYFNFERKDIDAGAREYLIITTCAREGYPLELYII